MEFGFHLSVDLASAHRSPVFAVIMIILVDFG